MSANEQNILGVELVADHTRATQNVREFEQTVLAADRAMQQAGGKATVGDDYAQQTQKAQVSIAQTTKAVQEAALTIDRSYTQGAQAVAEANASIAQSSNQSAANIAENARKAEQAVEVMRRAATAPPPSISFGDFLQGVRAEEIAEEYTKGTAKAQRELTQLNRLAESVQDRFAKLSGGKFGAEIAGQAEQANKRVAELKGQIDALNRELARGGVRGARPLSLVEADAKDARRELALLERQARETTRAIAAQRNTPSSPLTGALVGRGAILSTITQGVLGANALTAAIGFATTAVVEYGKASAEAYLAANDAQQRLIADSINFGVSLTDNLKAARELADALNTTLPEAQSIQGAAASFAVSAGRPDQSSEIARQAADLGAANAIPRDQIDDALRAIAKGNGEAFGIDTQTAINAYALSIGELPSKLDETQKQLALLTEFERKSAFFNGEGAQQAKSLTGEIQLATGSFAGFVNVASRFSLAGSALSGLALLTKTFVTEPHLITEQARERADALAAQEGTRNPQINEQARLAEESANLEKEARRKAEQDERERVRKVEEAARKQQQQLRAVQKDAEQFFNSVAAREGANNPFVRIFTEGATVASRMQERFKELGGDVINQMTAIEQKALDVERTAARIQSSQKVIDIQGEIRRLEFGRIGTSAEDDRLLSIQRSQIEAARATPGLLAQADAIERGLVGQAVIGKDRSGRDILSDSGLRIETERVGRQQFDELRALKDQFRGDTLYGNREANSLVNRELIGLYHGLDPKTQASIARGGAGADVQQQFAAAFREEAAERRRQIDDARKQAGVGRFGVELAEDKLRDLSRYGGFDDDNVRKQYLAVTGALSEKELTPELRRGRILAQQEEAKQEAAKEKMAEEESKERREFFKKITALLTEKGLKVDGATSTLTLINESDAAIKDDSLGGPTR